TSPGILRGGKLAKKVRKLKVKGELKNIPEYINIDISGLDILDSVKVNALKVESVQFLEPANKIIVTVLSTRNVEAAPTA
ncbi:MAG: hypothetical protein LBU51_03690, partial [Bacteroidales bacterium]|nr:hypothetical protein [Bacteroidales bacterium]